MSLQLQYFDAFLALAGDAVDRVAYHMYVDGGNNPKLEADLTSPTYLDRLDAEFLEARILDRMGLKSDDVDTSIDSGTKSNYDV